MAGFYESLKIRISEDKTQAFLSVKDLSDVPAEFVVDAGDLTEALKSEHSLIAIDADRIQEIVNAFNESQAEISDELVADTKQPMVPGTDAYIEWLVDLDPKLEEDASGNVDFYSFSALRNVKNGDPLCIYHPEVQGQEGLSVTGEAISGREGEAKEYSAGENVEYEEAEKTYYATTNGRVELRDTTICVSRLYEVEGDVDFSTGNIQFDGFVRVSGDVQDNFMIEASDGVQIDGVLQAARIKSGGAVSVIGGVNSRGKGGLQSDADVLTKFVNNANIECRGTLKVENELVNSKVVCGGVDLSNGSIAGGETIASENVRVKDAGSSMAVRTVIHAGFNQFAERRAEELRQEVLRWQNLLKRLDSKLAIAKDFLDDASEDKRDAVYAMEMRIQSMKKGTEDVEKELDKVKAQVHNEKAQIEIESRLFAGVVLRIGKYEKMIGENFEGYRRYTFDKKKYELVPNFEPAKK